MMAFAMVNNVAVSPEPFPSYGWLSPRISFSRDLSDAPSAAKADLLAPTSPDGQPDADADFIDFEFRLDDPVNMLPADELFSEGKLVPLQLATTSKPAVAVEEPETAASEAALRHRPEARRKEEVTGSDPYVFSPRAPSCTSRWRELLGLRRSLKAKRELHFAGTPVDPAATASAAGVPSKCPNPRSLKGLLQRSHKSGPLESSLRHPLLRDSDLESVSVSSRLSLSSSSSSSSGPDHEDLPRLSLDSDRPNQASPIYLSGNPPRVRLFRPSPAAPDGHHAAAASARAGRSQIRRAAEVVPQPSRGGSVDSPRMSSSGKIVFQGLERSSSHPGSVTGGPRPRPWPRPSGIERSYSANVRVTPVLNVPVCSLRSSNKSVSVFGFGQLFSPQKKERVAGSASAGPKSVRSNKTKPSTDRVSRD